MIRDASVPSPLARRVLGRLQEAAALPWDLRESVAEAVAAIVSLYPEETSRKPTAGQTFRVHVANVCRPMRIEWCFNASRFLHTLGPNARLLLPSGTCSNESLHAELGGGFEGTVQMHRATLHTRLKAFQLAKLISHNAAFAKPTVSQQRQTVVLHRAVASMSFLSRSAWAAFCALPDAARGGFKDALARQQRHLRVLKRPGGVLKRPGGLIKARPAANTPLPVLVGAHRRTAFRLKRKTRVWY